MSPQIYMPVNQEVMDYCLKVPKHNNQLKKVDIKLNINGKHTSVTFVGVPVIEAHLVLL